HAPLKGIELALQNGTHREQRLSDRLQVRLAIYQLLDASGKAAWGGLADLQPEAAQDPAQAVLDLQKLARHQLASRQDGAYFLRIHRLAVPRPEPAKAHQLRDPARVVAVRLHRHCSERITHV